MSFTSGLHAYEECISDGMIATISFQDKQLEQCTVKKECIEESLVKNSILSTMVSLYQYS